MNKNGKSLLLIILIFTSAVIILSYLNKKVDKRTNVGDPVADQINLEAKDNAVILDTGAASSTDSETLEQ